MICSDARDKLQELFTWWALHVKTHTCVGCSIARVALATNAQVQSLLRKEGVQV